MRDGPRFCGVCVASRLILWQSNLTSHSGPPPNQHRHKKHRHHSSDKFGHMTVIMRKKDTHQAHDAGLCAPSPRKKRRANVVMRLFFSAHHVIERTAYRCAPLSRKKWCPVVFFFAIAHYKIMSFLASATHFGMVCSTTLRALAVLGITGEARTKTSVRTNSQR